MRRRRGAFLCFDVDCDSELEFHGEVVAFDVVLRNGAVVLDPLFCQEVCGICFLKKGVTHVLLVAENLADGAGVPFCLASAGEDTVSHEPVGNLIHAGAFEVFSVDPFYDFCLLRIDDQVPKYYVEGSHEAIINRVLNRKFSQYSNRKLFQPFFDGIFVFPD